MGTAAYGSRLQEKEGVHTIESGELDCVTAMRSSSNKRWTEGRAAAPDAGPLLMMRVRIHEGEARLGVREIESTGERVEPPQPWMAARMGKR